MTLLGTNSIQSFRETMGRNRGAMLAVNRAAVGEIDAEFDRLEERNAHRSDWRRLHIKIANVANEIARRPDFYKGSFNEAFEGFAAYADVVKCKIDNQELVAGAIASDRGIGTMPGVSSGWVSAETGEPVRIYNSRESLVDNQAAPSGVSVGELLAAKLFGAKSAAIQAALSEGTDSAGGYTVPVQTLPQFIDKLRSKAVFVQAGARTLMLDTATTKIARISGDPVAAWRAESAPINLSDPTFSALTFAPKSLAANVKLSRELLADSVNIADAVETALLNAMSLELDRACLLGSGSSNQPLGLFGTSGINTVSMGTNGAAPTTYDNLLDAIYELELDNARGITAAIWHPRTARTYRKMKDTTGQPLQMPDPIDTLPKLATTAIPITQTQGTNSDCSTVFFGYFPSAIIGLRERLTLQILPELYAATGEIGIIAHMRADVGFEHPEEFCTLTGVR